MLLFEHKQYLQSCGAESSMQRRYGLLKFWQFNAYKNDRGRGHAALEKRKRKLGVHITIYSYESRFCLLTILMDSQVSKSLKQRFYCYSCRPALHLSLSLSLSHSDQQISSNKLFQLYTYFHTAMRSIINGHACGCCAVLKL